ncbi:hypothetical protein [Kingella oralis]
MTPNRLLALLTLLATLAFHLWQNYFAPHGGSIALPKSLWLGLTLYCWLLQPPLIIRRSRNPRAQTIWRLFWAIMLIRASAELWLLTACTNGNTATASPTISSPPPCFTSAPATPKGSLKTNTTSFSVAQTPNAPRPKSNT